jgi:hypothetical protein
MGYLVGWRNEGNYLGSFLKGARDDGICPAETQSIGGMNDHRNRSSIWPMGGDRELYLLGDSIELNPDNMQQMCVSACCNGYTIYVAYMWWGHAVELVAYRYRGGELQTIISNSHNETDYYVLTGSKAVPYEAHAILTTVLTEPSTLEVRQLPDYLNWNPQLEVGVAL